MRGHLRQLPSGSWQVMVYAGKDRSGKKRWRSATAATKKGAEKARTRLLREIDMGRAPEAGTFGELLEDWFAHATLADYTRRTTRTIIDRHLAPLHDRPLDKITTAELDRFYRSLVKANGDPLAASTVSRIHGVVHRALNQAVRWQWIPTNPATVAEPPEVPRVKPRAASVRDAKKVMAKAPDDLALWLRLVAATGARRGEACGLRWDRVGADFVLIDSAIADAGGRQLVSKGTKTGSERVVALDAKTVKLLTARRKRQAEACLAAGEPFAPDAFVFSHEPPYTRPWRPDYVSKQVRLIASDLGVTVRPKDLRSMVSTELQRSGIKVGDVADRLGHSKVMTVDRYRAAQAEEDRKAAQVMGRLLG